MPCEHEVRLAAKLYELRDTARSLLGDRYATKMQELGGVLSMVAEKTQREPLSVAIEAARDAAAVERVYILAAAVELAEPSREPGGRNG